MKFVCILLVVARDVLTDDVGMTKRKVTTVDPTDLTVLKNTFMGLGLEFTCRTPQYEKQLARLPALHMERGDLRLPRNSRLLFFGHSYLRQVFLNFLAADFDELSELRSIKWTGWKEPVNQNAFKGCVSGTVGHGLVSAKVNTNKTKSKTDWKHVLGHGATLFRFGSFNTTVYLICNFPELQNPSCFSSGQMSGFLRQFGPFHSIAFMMPHGDGFDQYLAAKNAGFVAEHPCNLSSMTCTGDRTGLVDLVTAFATASKHLVYVEPWLESPIFDIDHPGVVDHLRLGVYVHSLGEGLCTEPLCEPSKLGHQCLPGALTFAARDLNRLFKRRVGGDIHRSPETPSSPTAPLPPKHVGDEESSQTKASATSKFKVDVLAQWQLANQDLNQDYLINSSSVLFGTSPRGDSFYEDSRGVCHAAVGGRLLVYVRVYKAGNNCVCESLKKINDNSYPIDVKWITEAHWSKRANMVDLFHWISLHREKALVFTFVREPIEHLVSGYMTLLEKQHDLTAMDASHYNSFLNQNWTALVRSTIRHIVAHGLGVNHGIVAHLKPQFAFLSPQELQGRVHIVGSCVNQKQTHDTANI